ncbi:hypothetical protein [Actinosynnema sp. NPDC020468]|uniref:hypothetical protein n=1 Tax=Actinosynnema sp. NPDC020468 TaxID=3154488 RepID=UPI0033ED8BB3
MARPSLPALITACVAVAVTIAGMGYAWTLRPPSAGSAAESSNEQDDLRCGTTTCRSVVSTEVGTDTVEVLVGPDSGRIRTSGTTGRTIFELTIAQQGASIGKDALQCVDAEVAVCLVRGAVGADTQGEAIVRRSGAWSRAALPYVSTGGYLALHDVNGDGVVDVVAVQRACATGTDCPNRYAQVFSVVGGNGGTTELGCTTVTPNAESLPGWPVITPDPTHLQPCGA